MKDAQEIFKDRPEAAKKLIEAIMKACSGCKIPIKQENDRPKPVKTVTESPLQKKMEPILKRMMKILTGRYKRNKKEFVSVKLGNIIGINLHSLILQPIHPLRVSQERKIRLSKRKTSRKAWCELRKSCYPKMINSP